MIASLRESKAHLSALVERASHGEEVVITVRGTPKARLCPLPKAQPSTRDKQNWGLQVREAREAYSTGTHDSTGEIMDDLRGDRT